MSTTVLPITSPSPALAPSPSSSSSPSPSVGVLSASQEQLLSWCESLKKSVEKADRTTSADYLDLFHQATGSGSITAKFLKDTQVGHLINRLRSHADKQLAEKATKLTLLWKSKFIPTTAAATAAKQPLHSNANGQTKQINGNANQEMKKSTPLQATPSHANSSSSAAGGSATPASSPSPARPASAGLNKSPASPSPSISPSPSPSPSASSSSAASAASSAAERSSIPKCGDAQRDKIRGLLFDALGDPPRSIVSKKIIARSDLAAKVESEMYVAFPYMKDPSKRSDYNAKFRTLKFNLKDADNPQLNEQLFTGEITAKRLVEMESADMAPAHLKEERERIRKEKDEASRGDLAAIQAMESDEYQCPKCHESKCTFSQQQTRGADEPMTTFVSCLVCGHRWRDGDNAHE